MKYLACLGSLVLLASCGGASDESSAPDATADQVTDAPAQDAKSEKDEPKYTRQDVPGSVIGREVAEVTLDEIKPAFTTETVTKLNAIVKRSLTVSTEYSRTVKSIRRAVAAAAETDATAVEKDAAQEGIDQLRAWHETAVAAKADMDEAAATLEASDESYSEELLAGMVKYVTDVEKSISAEISTLTEKLNAA
ncbi:MAG: hypothetical protein AAGJ73_02310 [Pseudomonadota bacterium]